MSDTNNDELLERINEWYDTYEDLSDEEEAASFLSLLKSNKITFPAWEEADLGGMLVELWSKLWKKQRFEEVFALFEEIRQMDTKIYEEEFVYLAEDQFDYAVYKKNQALAQESIDYFEAHPTRDIDLFLKFRKKLWYWLDAGRGERLARKTYRAVADKEDSYMGSPHRKLGFDVFLTGFQREVEALKPGDTLNFTVLEQLLTEYLPNNNPDLFVAFGNAFTRPWDLERMDKAFTQKEESLLLWGELRMRFLAWMHQRGFPFVTSNAIFNEYVDYWEEKNGKAKTLSAFCRFDFDDLDHFLASKKTFFTPVVEDVCTIVWGVPFVNDFLLEHQIADAQTHTNTKQIIIDLKRVVIEAFRGELWKVSYVNSIWPKPDSVEPSERTAEVAIFATSFDFKGTLAEFRTLNAASYAQLPVAIEHELKKPSRSPIYKAVDNFFDEPRPGFRTPSAKSTGSNYTPPQKKNKKKKKKGR